ncbi:MAG TPA: hypothetical protein VG369_06375, partial [Humibacter sp.]|nr:hypothetical protein [Humibacter sp.]
MRSEASDADAAEEELDLVSIALLRDDLLDAGYTVARLQALWGEEAAAALGRGQRTGAKRAAAGRVERADPVAV